MQTHFSCMVTTLTGTLYPVITKHQDFNRITAAAQFPCSKTFPSRPSGEHQYSEEWGNDHTGSSSAGPQTHTTLTAPFSSGTCTGAGSGCVRGTLCYCQDLQVLTTWNGFANHILFLPRFTSLQNKQKMEVSTNCMFRLFKCVSYS